uniref:Uncharacterized protein n=1 Tax=Oryza glumipatula TaxID=40148 RepID=A0A0D9YUH5_9ORYZ
MLMSLIRCGAEAVRATLAGNVGLVEPHPHGARRQRRRLALQGGASSVEETAITATAIAAGGGVGGVEEKIVKLFVG